MTSRGLLAALALLPLAACGGTGTATPVVPTPTPSGPFTAELRQFRSDIAFGKVEVTLHARVAFSVASVQLRTTGFATLPASAQSVDYRPGASSTCPSCSARSTAAHRSGAPPPW